MKKLLKLLLFLLFTLPRSTCLGQQVVFDRQHFLAATQNGAVRSSAELSYNGYLSNINSNLNNINANVSSVLLAQTIIYHALSDINSALKDGIAVKNMSLVIADMSAYLNQCATMAQSQPYLVLFASNLISEMTNKSISLLSEVSGYILKEDSNILADYNSRDQLLRKVSQQLQLLNSLAYGAWRAMYWAKQRGIIASVNPWQSFISKDKQFVAQIIATSRYLKQ